MMGVKNKNYNDIAISNLVHMVAIHSLLYITVEHLSSSQDTGVSTKSSTKES